MSLIEKEIRPAELEIAQIRERYHGFSKEALPRAIEEGKVAGHPAWEDYIVWKNKEVPIIHLRQIAEKEQPIMLGVYQSFVRVALAEFGDIVADTSA